MNAAIFARQDGVWLNEPERWTAQRDSLEIVTDKATDFWRKTHYGFCRDSGHFLGFRTAQAFTAELRVQCDFQALYDQAGIMVRIDAERWIKAGIEFSDGRAMLSSVLTNGQSDWATAPYEHDAGDFWMRVTVADGVLRLQASMAKSGPSSDWLLSPWRNPTGSDQWLARPNEGDCRSRSRDFP